MNKDAIKEEEVLQIDTNAIRKRRQKIFEKYALGKSRRKIKNNQDKSGAGKTLMMVNF